MDLVHVIRHKVLVQQLPLRQVARETGASRNTIKKYLAQSEPRFQKRRARSRPTFELVKPRLDALLTEWQGCTTSKQRLTAARLYRQLFIKGGPDDLHRVERKDLFLGEEVALFRYYSPGLSGAEAERYLACPEPLAWALAALMSFKGSDAQHKLACMQRLVAAKLDLARQFLLIDCIQTYIPLAGQNLQE